MGQITGGALDQRVTALRLAYDQETGTFAWEEAWGLWAKAEQDERSNLFSSVGIGARGVTFTLRRNPRLTLHNALRWRGRHCFLTAIRDAEPGFVTVKAALASPASCRAKRQRSTRDGLNRPVAAEVETIRFPGIVTDLYRRNEADEISRLLTRRRVLVTPKDVVLDPGTLVRVSGGGPYTVRTALDLDDWKNEYEMERQEDV